jgi:hypothetical protein
MIPSNYLTGTEAISLVNDDELTLEQVLQDHQERYEQRNDRVKAWVCVDHTILNDKAVEGPLRGRSSVSRILSVCHTLQKGCCIKTDR